MGPSTLKRIARLPARALVAAGVAAAFAVAFSAPSCSSSSSTTRPDGGPVCEHGGPACPTGTACQNGNCVPTCPPGTACPAGQYCLGTAPMDQVCAPTSPTLCTSLYDCPTPQNCLIPLCTALEPQADGGATFLCNPDGSVDDKCATDAICLVLLSSNGLANVQCRGMPACGQNGSCPVGQFGAVCNVQPDGGRILPGKERICLFGFCSSNQDCAGNFCVHNPDASVGGCYSGFTGSPCNTSTDCFHDGGCIGADAGVWGACDAG
jgi:hypothetical protein